jgi:hypothetical protein
MKLTTLMLLSFSVFLLGNSKPAEGARFEQWLPFKFSEGVVACPKLSPERKVGFIDRDGKTVIDAKFDAARPFSQGLAAVRLKGKWGYIGHDGKYAIEPQFDPVGVLDYPGDDPMDFSEDCAAVRSEDLVGFIDRTGKFVIPPKFTSAWAFNEGLAAAQDRFSGKWGFIDKQGKWAIKPTFADALSFSDGVAAVSTKPRGADAGWGYINKSGSFVVKPQYALALAHHDGLALVLTLDNGTYKGKYIDKKGDAAFTNINCHGSSAYGEGLAPFLSGDRKAGFIDKSGKTVIEPQFQEARTFSEGLAVVRIDDGHWGLVDKKGKLVLSRSIR